MKYQEKIDNFLKQVCEGPVELDPKLVEELGEAVKQAIIKQFSAPRSNKFGLRMSNIGYSIRQLHLQKLYGRPNLSPDTKMRMLYGDLVEAVWMFIIKSAGIKVLESQKQVTLDVDGFPLPGTLDLIVENEETGQPEVVDIKSTAYISKFKDIVSVSQDDSFGYLPQIFGYAEAEKKDTGGLWVFDKKGGGFKIVGIDSVLVYNELKAKALKKIKDTVAHFRENKEIPPCPGFVDETFYGKPTGDKVLNEGCKFCDFKEKCHPGICLEPCRVSKAKDKPLKWYKPK